MPPADSRARPKLWLAVNNRGAAPDASPETGRDKGASPAPPQPSLDDAQLLQALRAGDPTAATSLHDRARPQVDRTVARLLGARDVDREDLAQLAMIELVTTIDRFRGDCSLDSWVSMVTARVVFKHIRRRQTERRIFAGVELDDTSVRASPSGVAPGALAGAYGVAPARHTMLRGLMARVRAHLEAIDENKAWTFLLHDVCGYDLREIAEITGVSVAAAQTRLTRGRREIHERIAADPDLAGCLEQLEGEP